MKSLRVDHIGIAVSDLDGAIKWYEDTLGIKCKGKETVEDQHVTTAFLPCGDAELELLYSTTPDGSIAKFIEKKGQGIQHIAIRVDNVAKALEELKAKGVRLIDQQPRRGAGGAMIAFVHPKATNGVLLELCERK
jgi:methylmalonyl-CoA epimerase